MENLHPLEKTGSLPVPSSFGGVFENHRKLKSEILVVAVVCLRELNRLIVLDSLRVVKQEKDSAWNMWRSHWLTSECYYTTMYCLTVKFHGLSANIARKYPWADLYQSRTTLGKRNLALPGDRLLPGAIQVFHSPTGISRMLLIYMHTGTTAEEIWNECWIFKIPPLSLNYGFNSV